MGLDGIEFIMELEAAFQISIPDAAASDLTTPRLLTDYLFERLSNEGRRVRLERLEQRAFYRLRSAATRLFVLKRGDVSPESRWDDILPKRGRRGSWALLGRTASISPWPPLTIWGGLRPSIVTVGSTSRYAATHAPASLRHATETWSRSEIEAIVQRLMRDCLGISEFGWNQEFVRDLGVE